MSEKEVIIGNLTTIIMFVFSACGGGAIIDSLGGTSEVAIVVGAIIGLGFSFVNAYFPNFFGFLNNNRKVSEPASEYNPDTCTCACIEDIEDEDVIVDDEDGC